MPKQRRKLGPQHSCEPRLNLIKTVSATVPRRIGWYVMGPERYESTERIGPVESNRLDGYRLELRVGSSGRHFPPDNRFGCRVAAAHCIRRQQWGSHEGAPTAGVVAMPLHPPRRKKSAES
jgi:hypothetical protein